MAVLHITYRIPAGDRTGRMMIALQGDHKLPMSKAVSINWTIYTEEAPKAAWHKLKGYIDPNNSS